MEALVIVTAHQPNWLPGMSVVEKIGWADTVIWLDEVQYSKGGWTNRNKLPSGAWLTVPVERATDGLPINRVRLVQHDTWRRHHVRALRQEYGSGPLIEGLCAEILRPYGLLVGLNLALLRPLLAAMGIFVPWHFQSHLDGGHAVTAVSDVIYELLPISERLAMMVAELGGSVYLSGPSGFRYLDERPFSERGIEVRYFEFSGPNPSAIAELASKVRP
jgi:hypothetical protein